MPRLPKALREAFPAAKTLYDVLGCAATATEAELKKAYYRAALRHHPDKAGQGEGATARFQALSLAHSVLSDPARRQEYDETGEVEEGGGDGGGGGGGGEGSFASGYAHWRAMFPAFTTADIDAFAQRYRGSAEEVEDVLAAYAERRGNMDAVLDSVPCSRDDDDARFAAIVHAAIADGRAKPLRAFVALYGSKAAAAPGAAAAGGKEGGGDEVGEEGDEEEDEDEEEEEGDDDDEEEEEEEEEAGAGASAAAAARKGRKGFWKRGSAGGSSAAAAAPRAAAAASGAAGSAHKLAASRAARSARAAAEAAEAEELLAKMQKAHAKKTGGTVGEASLEAMIRARAEERNKGMGGFLADLESKYSSGKGGGGGGRKASAGALEDAKPAAKRGKK